MIYKAFGMLPEPDDTEEILADKKHKRDQLIAAGRKILCLMDEVGNLSEENETVFYSFLKGHRIKRSWLFELGADFKDRINWFFLDYDYNGEDPRCSLLTSRGDFAEIMPLEMPQLHELLLYTAPSEGDHFYDCNSDADTFREAFKGSDQFSYIYEDCFFMVDSFLFYALSAFAGLNEISNNKPKKPRNKKSAPAPAAVGIPRGNLETLQSSPFNDFAALRYPIGNRGAADELSQELLSPSQAVLNQNYKAGTASITYNALTLNLDNPQTLRLTGTTHRLFNALMTCYASAYPRPKVITFDLDEYMRLCSLNDKRRTREQLNKDLQSLASLEFKYRDARFEDSSRVAHVFASHPEEFVNRINLEIDERFYENTKDIDTRPAFTEEFTLNPHEFPNASIFISKIAVNKCMNRGKSDENIISVKSLLDASTLPRIELIRITNRRTKERIIAPFERDLNAANTLFTWRYKYPKASKKGLVSIPRPGKLLTQEEIENLDIDTFSILNIEYTFIREFVFPPKRIKAPDSKKRLSAGDKNANE